MAAANWQMVLTDTSFRPVGEILNAKDRQVSLALSKMDTLSCNIRLDNPLADTIVSDLGYIKAYRSGTLVFYGPIIGAEETADASAASIAITAAGAPWFMTKRLVGKSAPGRAFTSLTDRAVIAQTLISEANAEAETGIDTSALVGAGSSITYNAGPYRTLSDTVTELATGYDGFDWRVVPLDNYAAGAVTSQKIGQFTALPVMGGQMPEALFEWGTGRSNVRSYSRVRSRDTQANKVYHNASAGPDAPGYPTKYAYDASAAAAFRLLEDLAQADLNDATLRQQLVDEHVRVRKDPRTIVKFEPHIDPAGRGRLPDYGNDYNLGDWVRFRAEYRGVPRIDAWLRVYGVTFSIDDNGVERASAILSASENS